MCVNVWKFYSSDTIKKTLVSSHKHGLISRDHAHTCNYFFFFFSKDCGHTATVSMINVWYGLLLKGMIQLPSFHVNVFIAITSLREVSYQHFPVVNVFKLYCSEQ